MKSYSPSYYFLTNRHIPRHGRISWLEPLFLSEAQGTTPVGPSRNKHLHSEVPSDQDVQPYAMFSMSKPVCVLNRHFQDVRKSYHFMTLTLCITEFTGSNLFVAQESRR